MRCCSCFLSSYSWILQWTFLKNLFLDRSHFAIDRMYFHKCNATDCDKLKCKMHLLPVSVLHSLSVFNTCVFLICSSKTIICFADVFSSAVNRTLYPGNSPLATFSHQWREEACVSSLSMRWLKALWFHVVSSPRISESAIYPFSSPLVSNTGAKTLNVELCWITFTFHPLLTFVFHIIYETLNFSFHLLWLRWVDYRWCIVVQWLNK